MDKIPSFTVNHLELLPGVYVSRRDRVGEEVLTTFDLRFTRPNAEPVMDTAAVHALEHLGATYLRNDPEWRDRVVYFGPMGCRTGFYLILAGEWQPDDIRQVLKRTVAFIGTFSPDTPIPGASARDCGNYLDMNLAMAKYYAKKFFNEVLKAWPAERTRYPE